MAYQRKPRQYDYLQYDGTNATAIQDFANRYGTWYNGYQVYENPYQSGVVVAEAGKTEPEFLVVQSGYYLIARTAEGYWYGVDPVEQAPGLFVADNINLLEVTP